MLLPPSAHRHRLSCVCSSNTASRSRMCSLQVFDCRRRSRPGVPLQLQQGHGEWLS